MISLIKITSFALKSFVADINKLSFGLGSLIEMVVDNQGTVMENSCRSLFCIQIIENCIL